MKPQAQGNVMYNSYHQDDIKPDAMLMNKEKYPSQYQDGDNISYPEKEALKQLPEASSWPKFSGTGEYDHMELLDYIYELFIDVTIMPDYWITARLNTAFKRHASIWFTEMKKSRAEETVHGGRFKSSRSKAIVLGYGKRPFHLKLTNDLFKKIVRFVYETLDNSSKIKSTVTVLNINI
ncbi:hypothetical protein O181_125198 [Austropuccinia psidii MF-1]|uniref:Uncharacterized protein n=1 Tax=Austropuccinia psidii MF-1 TaxID=1389203 RepID=A0A9Q3Q4T7_9BASI|nr:hypothetical protein [Austropuccinia psidii MF-1]